MYHDKSQLLIHMSLFFHHWQLSRHLLLVEGIVEDLAVLAHAVPMTFDGLLYRVVCVFQIDIGWV